MPLSNTLLELIQVALKHRKQLICNLTNADWCDLYEFATKQSVMGIVIEGIEQLPDDHRPPKELLLQWIGNVLQGYEYRF